MGVENSDIKVCSFEPTSLYVVLSSSREQYAFGHGNEANDRACLRVTCHAPSNTNLSDYARRALAAINFSGVYYTCCICGITL